MKAGHKTSEFYTALAGAVIPIINSSFGLNIPTESVVAAIGALAAYILSRTVLKAKTGVTQ